MRMRNFPTALFAGLLLLGTVTSVAAQTDTQEHDAHHPAETQATPPALPTPPGESSATAAPGTAVVQQPTQPSHFGPTRASCAEADVATATRQSAASQRFIETIIVESS